MTIHMSLHKEFKLMLSCVFFLCVFFLPGWLIGFNWKISGRKTDCLINMAWANTCTKSGYNQVNVSGDHIYKNFGFNVLLNTNCILILQNNMPGFHKVDFVGYNIMKYGIKKLRLKFIHDVWNSFMMLMTNSFMI